ncbi:G-protein beta WD-40 repeat-containing protein [Artemisia annua]|uniref:G-protein beta WD-40 repeat-containing protein n=1 Tax=Artemisia annua TaxID=35608 RepID=A0A2U1KV14_ARTAN|nr:G-protein beta WD-40 repeat-containing protein [Artemisia annua]
MELGATLIGNPSCTGLMMIILSTGHISRAHLNPSLTIGFSALHHFHGYRFPHTRRSFCIDVVTIYLKETNHPCLFSFRMATIAFKIFSVKTDRSVFKRLGCRSQNSIGRNQVKEVFNRIRCKNQQIIATNYPMKPVVCKYWLEERCVRNPCRFLHPNLPKPDTIKSKHSWKNNNVNGYALYLTGYALPYFVISVMLDILKLNKDKGKFCCIITTCHAHVFWSNDILSGSDCAYARGFRFVKENALKHGVDDIVEGEVLDCKRVCLKEDMRLGMGRRKRDDPDEDLDADINWVLEIAKSFDMGWSEIGGDRQLSGYLFLSNGKFLATCYPLHDHLVGFRYNLNITINKHDDGVHLSFQVEMPL